jgi:hypothetical protein
MSDMAVALLDHKASMDCTLLTDDDGTIQFHRIALAVMSEYFDKLFFGDFKESKEEAIAVTGGVAVWACIKTLVYRGFTNVRDMDTLTETIETLYKYDLKTFVPTVLKVMMQSTTIEKFTALRLLRVAALHENRNLGMHVMKAIRMSSHNLMDDWKWIQAYADVVTEIKELPEYWKRDNICGGWTGLE